MDVDQEGRAVYFGFDVLNRQDRVRDALGNVSYMIYDARGSVTKRIDAEGRTAYMEYDDKGRLFRQGNALGELTYFGHDARSDRVVVINPRNFSTYFTFDALRRLTHQKDHLLGVRYFNYDEVGNRVLSVEPANHQGVASPTYVTFDNANRTEKVIDALGNTTYMFYDAKGNMTRRVDARGRTTYLVYDAASRNTTQWFANPVETADAPIYYTFDSLGNLTAVASTTTSYPQDYDSLNRVTRKTNATGGTYYVYDKSSRLTKETMPDATSGTYWDFDAAGRNFALRTFESGAAERISLTYFDRSAMPIQTVAPNTLLVTYMQYDVAGRVKQKWDQRGFGPIVTYFAYTRNANGLPEKVVHESGGYSYFRYDALDRLTHEQRIDSSNAVIYGFYYNFDAASNRYFKFDAKATSLKTHYYTFDARNILTQDKNS